METQLSQDSLDNLIPPPDFSVPTTPEPPHATIPDSTAAAVSKVQSGRIDNAAGHMTPPPSTQVPSSQRGKTRTPTPTISHISTPPPTIEMPSQNQTSRLGLWFAGRLNTEQIASASAEELRTKVTELQAALQEAKMSAAHHKLQYQMLSQESAAAIERMAVEAHMAQYENEVIHVAEQAKAAATPVQPSPFQEGMIPVQKDLYQRMCREIQQLTEERNYLADEHTQMDKTILRQDVDIASLTDKVMLMRDRIRENREHVNRYRRTSSSYSHHGHSSTPRSAYNDPLRSGVSSQEQPQPFAALLQASEMASQEARRPANLKKGHSSNTHSMSSLPSTPRHLQKSASAVYTTPQGRQPQVKVPSTAPLPRTSALRTPDVYAQQALPVPVTRQPNRVAQGQEDSPPPSDDGTVSVAADDDEDSEAETEILEPEDNENSQDTIPESQASRAASQMLRSSQEQAQAKRDSFQGSGMLGSGGSGSGGGEKQSLTQAKLFGAVRKRGVNRVHAEEDEQRPAKRARGGDASAVGLGIRGVRE